MSKAIPLIKKYEGLRLNSYLCPSGLATIGYGATFYENGSRVQLGEKITIDRADSLLLMQIKLFENEVRRIVKSALNENQLGALVSFCFNIGGGAFSKSTLAKKANTNPNDPTIRDEFMRWTRGGGKVLPGLVKRREAEATLYFLAV
ncbi:COG3772 Phage-related lysozyme (muraminidase) [uncultured Caudovirales phage]|uniref:Endolysin n=1 Tax=uncultured Caudovirales phage TaxID=2100421 RepID=A0A6J5LUR9_9CAUD|nr:COG3772 Phage-related lysozyme (muraminidase) [uncultured Caudovirales phage]